MSDSNKMSGGKIAGAVIGSVAGAALIGVLTAFFIFKRRRQEERDEEDFFDMGKRDARMHGFDTVIPNNYHGDITAMGGAIGTHTHSNSDTTNSDMSNPEIFDEDRDEFCNPREEDFGRRRLSDGSLPDMVVKGPGSLKVVNR